VENKYLLRFRPFLILWCIGPLLGKDLETDKYTCSMQQANWWGCVVSFTPWLLYPPEKERLVPLDRRFGEPQESNHGPPTCHCTDWAVPDIMNNIKLTGNDFQQGGNVDINYCFDHYHVKSRYKLWNFKVSHTKWLLKKNSVVLVCNPSIPTAACRWS
jgi:hypothetical protein